MTDLYDLQMEDNNEKILIFCNRINVLEERFMEMDCEYDEYVEEMVTREINQLKTDMSDFFVGLKTDSDYLELVDSISGVNELTITTIKYFLYEQGYLNWDIRSLVFSANEKSKEIGINQDMTFGKSLIKFLEDKKDLIQESVDRYNRRAACYRQAKKNIEAQKAEKILDTVKLLGAIY